MNKNESKYFNTAVKMDEAMLSLLEKKEFPYITVKEICETAGVNRSTFYLHYQNTSELLSETTKYITDRFLSYFTVNTERISKGYATSELADLIFVTPEYLTPYLTFIKDHRRVFKTALKEFGSMGFDKVYRRMFQHIFDPILSRFGFCERSRPYVTKFYLLGITAIVMEWIERDCADGMDVITDIVIDCVLGKRKTDGKSI